MGAGASTASPTAAPDLVAALAALTKEAQAVPMAEQTSAQVKALADRLGELQAAANKIAANKAATETSAEGVSVAEWGLSVFKQFDTSKDGKISTKELARALKSLPKKKPEAMPEGAKFQGVDEMIAAMDTDGDGEIDEKEWLEILAKCAGLAAALAENVNAAGRVASFRSFEEQKAKREREVKALEAKEARTEEEEKELVEYKRQVESLAKKIEEAYGNQLRLAAWGASVFHQFDTDHDQKLTNKELSRALKSLPKTRPTYMPPGTKFMSVDEMLAAMDTDGDGCIDEKEWLENLAKCAGLAAALAENLDESGKVAGFRTFEQQAEKRKKQLAELEAKDGRSAEEEEKLVQYKKEVESWDKFFAEQAAAEGKAAAA
jgi:Ca2+-binding EF-hand superfamily protein